MGKKYIIEIEDEPFHKEDGDFLYRAKGFNSLVFDMTGISKLTPYTEPDLEQVRKEAYAEGFKDGQYAERNGLVANYAQKQEEIKVGDEVVFGNDEEIKAVVIDEADEAGVWLLLSENGCVERMDGVLFHRTGRHFSELTEIFKKMREE